MKTLFTQIITAILLCIIPNIQIAQVPDLGAATSFAVFTGVGSFTNDGATFVTGDIGTNAGLFSGFPPGVVLGEIHVADVVSAAASTDLGEAYGELAALTCGTVIGVGMGNGQILTPDIYCTGAATTINGTLTLDAEGDPDAVFIFLIDGALSTGSGTNVVLINGASLCNVWWQINGAFELGPGSVFRGNALVNGAISLLDASSVIGRALATVGAIDMHNNLVTIGLPPVPSVITASSSTTFCEGDSVILSGNVDGTWSTGATTAAITVTIAGDYYVVNTTVCGSDTSNHIIVTVNPSPSCTITGSESLCIGQTTELCVPAGAASYLWNTGATTNCITVSAEGEYSVTVTSADGCTSTCSQTVSFVPVPLCIISGDNFICEDQTTVLCALIGYESYLWNTGETTNCLTVSAAGTYTVTVTHANGCTSTCSQTVSVSPPPICNIIGEEVICEGQSTELCVDLSFGVFIEDFWWNTGDQTSCITVDSAGTYAVTITDENGCTSVCSFTVSVNPLEACVITGEDEICEGQSTDLCTPPGAAGYLWNTGATTNCVTVNTAGTYTVTITDENGCTSVCSHTVVVNPLPFCTITGNDFICEEGQSAELCATPGASLYVWSTGASSECITVNGSGTYSVTITDGNGCTSVCSHTVTVNPMPVCTITGDVSICDGQSTDLCVPPGALSYLWSTGETTNCISTSAAGTYSVTVTAPDGCVSTCSTIVTVNPLPVCSIAGDLSFCPGESTELCASAGASAYLWSTGETSDCITVATEGVFSVTITSADGCISTCGATVVANPSPVCLITGNNILCLGESTDLCVAPGAASYLWSTGETTNCISVNTEGLYSVTITDANGCTDVCSEFVTVNPLPECLITGDDILCVGESTDLCVAAGAASYLWSTGQTTNCISVNTAGTFSVTITDANGCSSNCSMTVIVNPLPLCLITGADIPCEGQSTELCALPGASSYLWNTAETTSCITVSLAGTYSVTVTDANGCTSTCDHVVIVLPSGPPSITCPVDVTIECDESTLPANTGTAIATGSCGLVPTVTFTDVVSLGACPQESVITRTWTATYPGGESITCVQVITVEDSTAPVIVCPPDITIDCDENPLPVNTGTATATDNCSLIPSINFSDVPSTGDCVLGITITRTWVATDGCGNTATCVQVITLIDNTPPVIEIVNPLLAANGDTTYIQCYGQDPLWDLPEFDENSVEATDICTEDVAISYSQVLLNEGDCQADGYILLYRLTWTATDECGNSSSAFVFLALVDTIAPVIYGVPGDTTVNCTDIPELPVLVYALDECLCACIVLVQESILPEGCLNGGVLIRTWTATDACGNVTTVSQRITIIDDLGPAMFVVEPEMAGMADGTILEFTCSEGGMPAFLTELDDQSVISAGLCGGSALVTFDVITVEALNCEFYGYIEQHTYQWSAVDECGNETSMSIIVRLIDDEAPVLIGVPEMACIADPSLKNIYAVDNCEEAYTQYWDVAIPNPCGTGMATLRTYEAYDDCGNSSRDSVILIPDDETAPTMEFINPDLVTDEILVINCASTDGRYTEFSADDVNVTDVCALGVNVTFKETLMSAEDCTTGEVLAVIELKWTATDVCGNESEHIVIAHVVDNSNPVFVNFSPEMTIGCDDALPVMSATDNCGDVVITTQDSIVQGDCATEYVVHRVVTATDPCGNETTRQQIIRIGGGGPIISGVEEDICDDLSMPVVTAYDACADEFVAVTMKQDTLDVDCREGLVIRRTWSAVDACGNVTVVHQIIVMNDQTPPEILIPSSSIINYILDHESDLMFLSQTEIMDLIAALDEYSIIVMDECDQDITPVLTIETLFGDCLEDGFTERRVYTWVVTDVCGNSASVSISVDIMDDVPPTMSEVTSDTTIVCVELPAPPEMLMDTTDGATMTFSEVITQGDNPNEFFVTRQWTATDSCGNVSVVFQRITWIPETYLVCEVLLPASVECNSHGVVIGSIVTGGFGDYTYEWEVVGEKCFIQGGQGTPEILIYVGWGDVKVKLTVTDSFGCVSMCMIILSCDLAQIPLAGVPDPLSSKAVAEHHESNLNVDINNEALQHLTQLNAWPNPTKGSLNLSFESAIDQEIEFTYTDFLGQVVMSDQFNAVQGLNTRTTNFEHLPPGSYLLQAKTESEMHTRVIVILPHH